MVGGPEPWTQTTLRELIGLAALVLLGALLLGRQLGQPSLEFDEGVYLLSADLLARGYDLGREVFTSQPPLFMALLDAGRSLIGSSVAALQGLTLALALGGAIAGWAIVRRLAGPLPALAALALIVLAPGVVDAAAVVSADVPCVALGTASLLAARLAREHSRWAAASGALIACALLIKLLAAPFAIALAVAAVVDRPPRRAFAWFFAGAGAVLAVVVLAYASVLGELWEGAVGMHLEARQGVELPRPSLLAQAVLITSAYAGLVAIMLVGLSQVPRAELRAWAIARTDLLAVVAAGLVLVAVHRPLLHHHLVIVAWPLALIAASTLSVRLSPRAIAVAIACSLLVVPLAIRGRDTVEGAEEARIEAIASVVEEQTPPDATVVSDLPLVPLTAGRVAEPTTVDPSYVRIGTGTLERADVLAATREADAVVVGRSFALVDGLEERLARRFETVILVGGARVYV